MSTTTEALTPPVWGSLSAGYRSMSWQNACPMASWPGGDRSAIAPAPWIAATCLGAAGPASIFLNAAPWKVGIVKVPRVLPCPSSNMESRHAFAAAASSFSRMAAS
jgi:hypothetical protein